MNNNSRTNVILLVLGVIVVAGGAYMLFARGDSAGSALMSEGTPGSEAESTFLALTAQLDPVNFDADVLDDPRFHTLRDIRTVVLPEPTGRPDPFAPLSGLPASN